MGKTRGEMKPANNVAPPRSPLRKHILSIPTKKLKSLPYNYETCHCCALSSDQLQLLESRWRVLLLCSKCISDVRSTNVCSYCFAEVNNEDDVYLNCLRCFHRIHYACIPYHRYYILPSQIDAESFCCMDCCPVFNSSSADERIVCGTQGV